MQGSMARACLVWGMACWGLTLGGPAGAQSAQERLEAARQAILEQALRQSTRVDALSWIDTQGRLQEFHAYRQSAQVPPSLPPKTPSQTTQQAAAWPTAAGANTATVDLLRQAAAEPCQRVQGARAPHAPLALQILWPARMPARTRERLQALITQAWLGNDRQRPWRMYVAAAPWPAQAGIYERMLVSPPSAQAQWTVQLQLDTLSEDSLERSNLGMRLSLVRSRPAEVLFEQRLQLPLEQRPLAWSVPEWKESAWQAIAQQIQAWTPVLDQQLACEKVEPEIVATESGQWVLNMGSLAGLRVGDEWALVNPAQLPERSLQPGALDQMVIARVTQVQALSARISLVAGDARAPQPGWVVRPLAASAMADVSWLPAPLGMPPVARR